MLLKKDTMEVKMNRNFVIITIVLTLASVGFYSFYKINRRHNVRLMEVSTKKIVEKAKECVWDDVCTEDTITLGYLIEKGYLKEEVNPITKKYYSHESYVEKESYTFHEV